MGAGLGWYSLSGALLTRLHSPELGALAFLSNVLREILAILLMPLLVPSERGFAKRGKAILLSGGTSASAFE